MAREWDFEQFFRNGLVELLDVEEEESAMIAMFVKDVDNNRKKRFISTLILRSIHR